ncbi:trimeric intracellular cation channel type 1B.1 [Dermatophagoides farinae]|uniref:Trimeric intracellular cation channel type a-like protein n=2 Tax=Pyroglyphidae TaxID=6952 RepID=A0A9D4NTV4_DERFA|nr:trimeric intracellular cation channel type 1B.1-like [Dermatophagoides farinae]KAH7638564.1 trimeric intracellular cation channel type a-like protein [Dermatophagoides farinae]
MDPIIFLDLANELTQLKMYPYFDVAHFIVTGLYLRDDLSTGCHVFSRKHPFACWISFMLSAFAGNILSAFLLGEPIVSSFKSTNHIILATAVWYVLFYSPFDFVYKLIKFLPCKLGIIIMKEIIRCKKINDGVNHAASLYPNSFIIMIIIGTVKGNGSSFSKLLERCIRGVWTPTAIEFMSPSFATKASIGASVVFILDKKTDLISAPHSLVYLGVVIFFIYFKLSSVLLGIHDPFLPFENLFCALCFGGIWDSLSDFITSKNTSENGTVKADLSKNGKAEIRKKD